LANIIAGADVGLIPYDDNTLWKNSLPAKFFEYCSCGIPVIATAYDDSLIARLIKNQGIGLVSSPLNDVELSENLQRLYNNPKLDSFGKRARAFIEDNFDRNQISSEYLNLVRDVINENDHESKS